ncbi:uncharacterized protein VTP21DRAFT_10687 [Calcarisporiella thermophila]|uniref:uncharacterized protein n=1 Tax=Calcarisporiella thermophila TaxID=911321 RepID=UPI003742C554
MAANSLNPISNTSTQTVLEKQQANDVLLLDPDIHIAAQALAKLKQPKDSELSGTSESESNHIRSEKRQGHGVELRRRRVLDDTSAHPYAPHSRALSPARIVPDRTSVSHLRTPNGGPSTENMSNINVAIANKPARSRWQQLTVEAGAVVGAGAAVVSEEGMKRLRYCQEWLQYALGQVEYQIALLHGFLATLTRSSASSEVVQANTNATLRKVKRDVVQVLRKVVDVVSRYAGSFLPEHARRNVRSFILSLPSRWAQLNTLNDRSATPSPASSPVLRPVSSTSPSNASHPIPPTEAAQRVLNLATESADTLRSIAGIFCDTIERADAWLERLRAVGVATNRKDTNTTMEVEPMDKIDDDKLEDEGVISDEDEEERENLRMPMPSSVGEHQFQRMRTDSEGGISYSSSFELHSTQKQNGFTSHANGSSVMHQTHRRKQRRKVSNEIDT